MADKSKNNSKFKSSSILDDISALHNINKTKNSRATGSEYETLAAAFLEQNGHTIITRNYRTRDGEIDEEMAQPEVAVNVAECVRLSKEKAAIAEKLEELYAKWEELA